MLGQQPMYVGGGKYSLRKEIGVKTKQRNIWSAVPRQGRGLRRIEAGAEDAEVDSMETDVIVGQIGLLNKNRGQAGMNSVANIHHRQSSTGIGGHQQSFAPTRLTGHDPEEQLPRGSVDQSIEFKVAQMLKLKESDPEGYQQAVIDLQSAAH